GDEGIGVVGAQLRLPELERLFEQRQGQVQLAGAPVAKGEVVDAPPRERLRHTTAANATTSLRVGLSFRTRLPDHSFTNNCMANSPYSLLKAMTRQSTPAGGRTVSASTTTGGKAKTSR